MPRLSGLPMSQEPPKLPNLYRAVPIDSLAVQLAGVAAEISHDPGEGQSLSNELQRLLESARPHKLDETLDVHPQGAARRAIGRALSSTPNQELAGEMGDDLLVSLHRE